MKSCMQITGPGIYLPEKRLTNDDLAKIVDTTDEWIVKRTGIHERRIAAADEFASDMAIRAVEDLIGRHDVSVQDVDMVIVSTFTPDHFTPIVAGLVQGRFNMQAGVMDINSGCAGFVYSLCVADALITSGHSRKVLVISSETTSKVADYTDRKTCILFGDAAAAFLVEKNEQQGCLLASRFFADGQHAQNVTCSNFSDHVNGHALDRKRLFNQSGRFVFEYVVRNVPIGIEALLNKASLSLDDIDWFVPHSANLRMISALCKKIKCPPEKMLTSVTHYGNTSSVTIPLAISNGLNKGKISKGDKLLLYGFGGGLTHGGLIIQW